MLAGAPPFNCPHASDCKYRTLVNDRATYWRYHEMHAAGAAGAGAGAGAGAASFACAGDGFGVGCAGGNGFF